MPQGKPAGERCVQLSVDMLCLIFGQPERPAVCSRFTADPDVCGGDSEEAVRLIGWWEHATSVA
jgi:hypothetical protein